MAETGNHSRGQVGVVPRTIPIFLRIHRIFCWQFQLQTLLRYGTISFSHTYPALEMRVVIERLQINGHLPETQKQRCPCCHAWVPLLFNLLFSFCMEISWLLNQPRGLDSSVRLKVQLAFCCLGRNSKSHLLELCFLQRLPQ